MRTPYTLFHLDGERGYRGGERQLLYLAAHLRAAGHRNIIVCRKGFPLDREAHRQGFETLHLPFWGEWDPVSAWKLKSAAVRRPRAVLHAHTGHTALLAAMASRLGRVPWVVHRRVDFALSGSISRRLKYDAAGRIIAVSHSIADILRGHGVNGDKITVIPDCLPLTPTEAGCAGMPQGPLGPARNGTRGAARAGLAQQFGLPMSAPWVGNLAALVPHKDQATLLRSVSAVRTRFPDVRFILLGDGPLADGLKTLARELDIEDAVFFPGFQNDPVRWLQSLDVYVQSSWGEGMGSVLLEAMACRLPIVATTAGGIPEVVENGRSALLVKPRSPEELGGAILSVLGDPAAAQARCQQALLDLQAFSLSGLGARVEEVYGGLHRAA